MERRGLPAEYSLHCRRALAVKLTAPHRTAPHRTAPHRTADDSGKESNRNAPIDSLRVPIPIRSGTDGLGRPLLIGVEVAVAATAHSRHDGSTVRP